MKLWQKGLEQVYKRAKIVPSVAWQSVHLPEIKNMDGAKAKSGTTDSKGER